MTFELKQPYQTEDRHHSKNPCGEIALGDWDFVQPWIQVQMMNMFRVKQGLPPYTPEERKTIIDNLQQQIEAELWKGHGI